MRKFFLYFLLLIAFMVTIRTCSHYKTDRDRLSGNQQTLLSGIEFYRTRDSLSVASVERLTLSNREFSRYCSDLEKQVKVLNLKVKRLQSVSYTATKTEYEIKTILKDSVLLGKIDTIQCLTYHDNYVTFAGCIEEKKFSGIIESRDTLIQIVHRVPRKFWFIRWGTKAIRQEIISKNPYSRICYTQYIELKN